jgi:hypothetical protein
MARPTVVGSKTGSTFSNVADGPVRVTLRSWEQC